MSQKERNEVMRLFHPHRKRHHSPQVQLNSGSTNKHELAKVEIVLDHMRRGHELLTEAWLLDMGGRVDVVCLDCHTIYEVVVSEKEESLIEKKKKYPLDIEVIKVE